jgi:hypothetical protein
MPADQQLVVEKQRHDMFLESACELRLCHRAGCRFPGFVRLSPGGGDAVGRSGLAATEALRCTGAAAAAAAAAVVVCAVDDTAGAASRTSRPLHAASSDAISTSGRSRVAMVRERRPRCQPTNSWLLRSNGTTCSWRVRASCASATALVVELPVGGRDFSRNAASADGTATKQSRKRFVARRTHVMVAFVLFSSGTRVWVPIDQRSIQKLRNPSQFAETCHQCNERAAPKLFWRPV